MNYLVIYFLPAHRSHNIILSQGQEINDYFFMKMQDLRNNPI